MTQPATPPEVTHAALQRVVSTTLDGRVRLDFKTPVDGQIVLTSYFTAEDAVEMARWLTTGAEIVTANRP